MRRFSSCIGTTTVTVTVYNADEEQIFKQDLKVKVKKNATDVTVTGIADGDKFSVGQTVDVTLPRQGVDTDERDLTVDKADNVEIKAGEKARTYTVKFLKAGEVTFTAKAFQSTKYPATIVKKDIKVTVANPAPTAVKAVAAEAFELTFDANVEDIYKDAKSIATDAIYYVINDTKIPFSAVKEVKATGNTVKVTMYDTFAAGTEYFVALADADALSFQIAGNAGKDVVGIKILTSTAVVDNGKAQDIKYALYNADGVDITTTAKADLNVNISLEAAAGTTNAYVSGETITMYTVGDVAEVSATFKFYDPNNNYTATTYTDTVKITAIAPSAYAYAGFVYTVDGGANAISMTYSNPKKYFALEDSAVFQAILKYTKDNASYTYVAGKDNFYNNKALVAKVADESIALIAVDGTLPAGKYRIKANQIGSTNVFIGYYDDNSKFITVAVAPIEVRAKRAAATLAVSANKSTLNDNIAAKNDDKIEITILVKDQYGDACNEQPTASQLTQSQDKKPVLAASLAAGAANWANPEAGKFVLTLKKTDFGAYAAGTNNQASIVLNFKTANGVTGTQSFSIADKAPTAGDTVAFGSNGSIDTSAVFTGCGDTTDSTVTLDVTTANSGYYTGHVDMSGGYTVYDKNTDTTTPGSNFIAKGSSAPQAGCVTGAGFALEVLKDGQRINLTDGITSWDNTPFSTFIVPAYDEGTIKVTGLKDVAGNLKKLPTGSYTFRVYYIKDGLIKVLTSVVSVTDKQVAPTFEQIKQSSTNGTDVASCFKFKFNGVDLPSPAEGAYTKEVSAETKGGAFVKKVAVTFTVKLKNAGVTTNYTYSVDINKLLNK